MNWVMCSHNQQPRALLKERESGSLCPFTNVLTPKTDVIMFYRIVERRPHRSEGEGEGTETQKRILPANDVSNTGSRAHPLRLYILYVQVKTLCTCINTLCTCKEQAHVKILYVHVNTLCTCIHWKVRTWTEEESFHELSNVFTKAGNHSLT